MAVDFNEIASYAHKLGVWDINIALELLREGKLPESKIAALKQVMDYAHSKGIKDFGAEVYKHSQEAKKTGNVKNKDSIAADAVRTALEGDLKNPAQGLFQNLQRKNEQSIDRQEIQDKTGFNADEALKLLTGESREEAGSRAQSAEQSERDRQLGNLDKDRFTALMNYHKNYNKLLNNGISKQDIETNPLWGNDSYREQILKLSPSTLMHDESVFSAIRNAKGKHNLYNRLEHLGEKPLPERDIYNKMLADYRYSTLKQNPANWFSNKYDYLRPERPQETGLFGKIKSALGY